MDELVRAAILGLRSGAGLPPPATPAEQLVPPASAPRALLLRAGARAVAARAGLVLEPGPPPVEAPEDTTPCAPFAVCAAGLAHPDAGLRAETLARVDHAGLRVPPALLPELLRSPPPATPLPLLRRVVGARGAWLAPLLGADALDEPDADALAALVETATRDARLRALAALRALDGPRAQALVGAAWSSEGADARASLLSALTPFTEADVPFLASLLGDRAPSVKALVVRALTALPCALSERAYERARPCFRWEGEALVVDPPRFEPSWADDLLVERAPAGQGARAWWLTQVVGRVAPARLFPGITPRRLLAQLARSDWGDAVVAGLLEAVLLFRDDAWTDALVPHAGGKGRPDRAWLLARLPAALAEAHVRPVLAQGDAALVAALPRPWSPAFGEAWLTAARESPFTLGSAAVAARALPAPCLDAALAWARDAAPRFLPAEFVPIVELRRRLHQEIA